MKTNISYQESIEILHSINVSAKSYEKIPFSQALGRILAQDIVAEENMPNHPTSAMDGYALSSEDIASLYSDGLEILSINKAGESEEQICHKGACIKTFTGAKIPINCDTLVLVEEVRVEGSKIYALEGAKIQRGKWIRAVGENYTKDEVLLKKGSQITPFEIGLLAELNCVFVCVYLKPKVAILSGGDEIIEVGEKPRENTIRSVNNHLLQALCSSMGAEGRIYPLLLDDKGQIEREVREALRDCDVLITTGGASKGDFDYTQEVIREVCEMSFKGVRMKPGKPVGFGVRGGEQFVFSLPGFPNSCAVTFMLFVRIIIARLLGTTPTLTPLKAKLTQSIKRADSRMEFRICNLRIENGIYEVGFWDKKTLQSSVVNNFCSKSALMILEENGADLQEGEMVEILLLDSLIKL
ncbi:molybdopterin molybdotransferase MoeA [Helicobacter brantae]|uniref:Molybdopterin molybdenumtransferase n=1 Tax=Helicobacter brantae TaxID=375927 RepID=A0A3D8J282_9HELI|nr:molybdopterin molybdotransferase MoeA [Helicobacter brantae]RDU70964.1 molybdopterin molybdenumtransferase MoeA [Helicobacter brantae]